MTTIDEQQLIISNLLVEFKEIKGMHGLNHPDTIAKREELEGQEIVLAGINESLLEAKYVASGYSTTTSGEQ